VLAQDLAAPYPTVRMNTPAREAAQLLAERHLPGLIVVDDNDHPVPILPGSQVLRLLVPAYVQDDPTLARVLEEKYADKISEVLAGRTVADMLPADRKTLPIVAPDDTVLEIAALMAANRSPLVAVVERRNKKAPMIGAVTAADLLERLLAGTASANVTDAS